MAQNEDLINAEAEAALIKAAVGRRTIERKISCRGGRKHETVTERQIPPSVSALTLLLRNRMPDKYSDNSAQTVNIEDVSETEEAVYGDKSSDKKDDPI